MRNLLAGLLLLALVLALVVVRYREPAPRGAEAPAAEFSAARAGALLREIAGPERPHPVGTRRERAGAGAGGGGPGAARLPRRGAGRGRLPPRRAVRAGAQPRRPPPRPRAGRHPPPRRPLRLGRRRPRRRRRPGRRRRPARDGARAARRAAAAAHDRLPDRRRRGGRAPRRPRLHGAAPAGARGGLRRQRRGARHLRPEPDVRDRPRQRLGGRPLRARGAAAAHQLALLDDLRADAERHRLHGVQGRRAARPQLRLHRPPGALPHAARQPRQLVGREPPAPRREPPRRRPRAGRRRPRARAARRRGLLRRPRLVRGALAGRLDDAARAPGAGAPRA